MQETKLTIKALIFELSKNNVDIYLENGGHGFLWHNDKNIISLIYNDRLTDQIDEFTEIEYNLSRGGASYKDYEGYQKIEDFMIKEVLFELAGNDNDIKLERVKVNNYDDIPPILNDFLFNTQEYINA
ncbi:MAG: hypothetical protein JW891_12415 [Candidatus Lokiarchaeota archaeon]|nr:hypothetical protein [Candidatus Lokiarchaeota archaeon]